MKNKIIALLILCVAGIASAQATSANKSTPREHRGFYASTSFGYAYNWYKNSRDDVDIHRDTYNYKILKEEEVDYFEFGGGTFTLSEFKFGVALGNLIALHSVFNFGFYIGSTDYNYNMHKYGCTEDNLCEEIVAGVRQPKAASGVNAYGFRTYVGFGTTLYPFQDKNSPMNGFFVGGSFGYTLFLTLHDGGSDMEDATGNGGVGYELEIGKEWWISDYFSIGVGVGYAHNTLIWETVSSHKSDNVISLSFRMTRG